MNSCLKRNWKMQKSTKSKIKITFYSTQKDLFVMIFLHRVELPSLILQRKNPLCFQAEQAVLGMDVICIFFILSGPQFPVWKGKG